MKTLLLAFVFLFACFTSSAQSWAPPGAEWTYTYFPQNKFGYMEVKQDGYEMIGSRLCPVFEFTAAYQYRTGPGPDDFAFDTSFIGHEYMYEDSGAVYWYTQDSFYKLYDFNAQVGDTMIIPGNNFADCGDSGIMVVDTVGTDTINGHNLRYYTMRSVDSSTWVIEGRIYERIGPLTYMFPVLRNCVIDVFDLGPLRCYSDDSFALFKASTVACDFIVGVPEAELRNRIKLYPNPANNTLFIRGSNNRQIREVIVYDVAGRMMPVEHTYNSASGMDISTLRSGMYFIRVANDKNKSAVVRVIKE